MTLPVDIAHAFVGAPHVLARGADEGTLAGTTMAVKDVFDVRGTVTGAGNPTFADDRPPASAHAEAVARLVAAGASVIGKTITDELAYSLSGTNVHFGTPINVAAPDRIPGGSSAGSVAAVAAGLCDLGLGTDTGGSIRVPASYCGVIGWRPTHGAVSARGVVPLAPSFDTVGLLARDIDHLRRAADVLLEPTSNPVAVAGAQPVTELLALATPAGRASVVATIATWGAERPVTLDVDLTLAVDTFRTLQGAEAWARHGAWISRVHPAMGPGITERFAIASRVTPAQVDDAAAARASIRQLVERATGGGRVLLGPAAPGAAPRLHDDATDRAAIRTATLQLTCLAGLAGAPVVVLPVASDGGLPLGVACLGHPGSDRELLAWAAQRLRT